MLVRPTESRIARLRDGRFAQASLVLEVSGLVSNRKQGKQVYAMYWYCDDFTCDYRGRPRLPTIFCCVV